MKTQTVVSPHPTEPRWVWAFVVNGKNHAEGEEAFYADARAKANAARRAWEAENQPEDKG